MSPLGHQGYIFEFKIIQPNFEDYYKKLEEEMTQQKSGVDLNVLIALLNQQYANKESYLKDPFSQEALEWVSKTKQLIAKVDFDMSQKFGDTALEYEEIKSAPMVKKGLTELIKNKILKQILDAKNHLTFSDEKMEEIKMEKAYEGGNSYAFLMDVITIIKEAVHEVFIIDPYFDDDRFNFFIQKIKDETKIKILISSTKIYLNNIVVSTFSRSNPQRNLTVKKSGEIHDRLIFADNRCWIMGQSIKNAAEIKPTYIIEITDILTMKKIYDDIWDRAVSI